MSGSSAYAAIVMLAVFVSMLGAESARADEFPGASGMALIDETHFLVVQDTKYDQPGDRIGVLAVDPLGGYDYTPLSVDWPVRPAHDMESCYGFRTREGEFLAAESGAYLKDWQDPTSELYQGRIWHLKVSGGEGSWHVEVLRTYDIPWELHEIEGMFGMQIAVETYDESYMPFPRSQLETVAEDTTAGGEQPEAASEEEDELEASPQVPSVERRSAIMLVTRGGDYPYEVARVYWGYVDYGTGEFALSDAGSNGRAITDLNGSSPWLRGCSDVYLDDHGCVWLAGCEDLGDGGPFRSRIVRYGKLDFTDTYWSGPSSYGNVSWVIDGVKIEALGAPVTAGCIISYATDDEGFGGIWRPLGPPSQPYWY